MPDETATADDTATAEKDTPRPFRWVGLDPRSLGAFRIVLGLTTIHNILWYRIPWVEQYYTEDGVLTRELQIASGIGHHATIFDTFSDPSSASIFTWIVLFVAIAFTLGYRTKVTSVLLFLGFSQILHANRFVAHAVEGLMDTALFWSMFLPLDRAFTKFGPKNELARDGQRGLIAWALVWQVAIIYVTSVVTKTGDSWWGGTLIYEVSDDRHHGGWLSPILAASPTLCTLITYGSLVIEAAIPLALLSPWANARARLAGALTIVVFHHSLSFFMIVGPFHWVLTSFAAALLPGMFWDRLGVKLPGADGPGELRTSTKPVSIVGPRVATGIAIFMLAWISHRFLANMRENSFFETPIRKTAEITGLSWIDSIAAWDGTAIGSGVFLQRWFFFAPDAWSEMGCVVLVGTLANGDRIDLVTNEPVGIHRDPARNKMVFSKDLKNTFSGSNWVYAMYVRRFWRDLPEPIYARWLDYEVEQWRKANPGKRLRAAELVLFINKTYVEDGEVTRDESLRLLHRKGYGGQRTRKRGG